MLHGPMVLDPASALEAKQWDSHLHAQGAAKMPCHIQVLWTTLERIKSTEGLEENPKTINPMKIIKDYQHLTEAVASINKSHAFGMLLGAFELSLPLFSVFYLLRKGSC